MFLYSNSMSVSRSLCFSSITPFSSSPSSLISFFFLCPFLHHTYPGWSEFTSPCSHPSLSLQPKEFTPMAPWAGMGGGVLWGRGFQRPAVPFHSPFPPALVPVLFCHLKGLHDLQSKHAPCHPLSCLATGSWGDPGLEQHPDCILPAWNSMLTLHVPWASALLNLPKVHCDTAVTDRDLRYQELGWTVRMERKNVSFLLL